MSDLERIGLSCRELGMLNHGFTALTQHLDRMLEELRDPRCCTTLAKTDRFIWLTAELLEAFAAKDRAVRELARKLRQPERRVAG